jgi:hypothetical protein
LDKKIFEIVAGGVGEQLEASGFGRQKTDDGVSAVFINEDIAYKIAYEEDKKRFNLMECGTDGTEPDGKWKSVSVWLFDPETDTANEAKSIACDFIETVRGPVQTTVARAKKKKKKDDDDNVDPIFFFNRFVGVFPELKAEINEEKAKYGDVRAVSFARENLMPKLNGLCGSCGEDDARVKKVCALLNDMYMSGDIDVRSIITIVIINGFTDGALKHVRPLFNEELQKSAKAALKIKGRHFKPEKKKKRKSIMAQALDSSNALENR